MLLLHATYTATIRIFMFALVLVYTYHFLVTVRHGLGSLGPGQEVLYLQEMAIAHNFRAMSLLFKFLNVCLCSEVLPIFKYLGT